ncbi:hypothetical protein Fmac_005791 [Flemingia macrophylla]|uniref:Uncharacterized protein n=1 Tax=Flemingia macrophylla TaxID=520843 RepID=A0ABD1N9A3_9FABA
MNQGYQRGRRWLSKPHEWKTLHVKDTIHLAFRPNEGLGFNGFEVIPLAEIRPSVLKNPDMDYDVLNLIEDVELRPEHYIGLNTMKDVGEPKQEEAGLKVLEYKELNMAEKERELTMSKDMDLKSVKNVEELKPEKQVELRVSKSIEKLKLMKAIEEMKSKLDGVESKLNEVRHAPILSL